MKAPGLYTLENWMVWCVNNLSENRLYGCWDLFVFFGHTSRNVGSSSLSGIEPVCPEVEVSSLNHCTAREVPCTFKLHPFKVRQADYEQGLPHGGTPLAGEGKYPLPSARDNNRMRWVCKSRRTSVKSEETHFPSPFPEIAFKKSSEVTGETSHQNLPFLLSPAVCPCNQPHAGSINSRVREETPCHTGSRKAARKDLYFRLRKSNC